VPAGDGPVGLILIRPTNGELATIFPDAAFSLRSVGPVFFGRPAMSVALVAAIRATDLHNEYSDPPMRGLFRATPQQLWPHFALSNEHLSPFAISEVYGLNADCGTPARRSKSELPSIKCHPF